MSRFDVAIGLDGSTLDKGTAQLYANPQARQKLFKGSQSGEMSGLPYTVSWDHQAAPTFILAPPPADKWATSINDQGQNPDPAQRPTQNAFQFRFPTLQASYTMGTAQPVSGTTEALVFCQVALADSKLSITPVSVWFDQSHMGDWDKFILNQVILPQVLAQARAMLAGISIPPLSFSKSGVKLELTDPVVTLTGGLLVFAASLKSKGSVDISGVTWPPGPLFTLLSAELLQQTAQEAVNAKLVGQTYSGDGSYGGALKYAWSATVKSVSNIAFNASDMTKLSAQVGFSLDATLKPLGVGGPCAISAATGKM